MKKVLREAITNNTPFWVLTIVAILMLVVAFILPPTAIIDKSILYAVSELMGFGALWAVVKAIDNGQTASVSHGNTTITIGKDDIEENDFGNYIPDASESDDTL